MAPLAEGEPARRADLYERRRCSAIKELGFFACGAVRSSKGEPPLVGGSVEETGGKFDREGVFSAARLVPWRARGIERGLAWSKS